MNLVEEIESQVSGMLSEFVGMIPQKADSEEDEKELLPWQDFISRNLYVQAKNRRLVPFRPNRAQRILFKVIRAQKEKKVPVRVITCKCRQAGLSTGIEAYIFTDTVSHENTNSNITAHELSSSKHLFGISRRFYDNLPRETQPMTRYSTRQELVFENPEELRRQEDPGLRSRIIVDTANKRLNLEGSEAGTLGRSFTFQNFHASEVAFWEKASVIMDAMMGSIPEEEGTSIFIESTGNTIGDYLYREWTRAREGRTDFVPIFIPWFFVEEYVRNLERPVGDHKKTFNGNILNLEKYEEKLVADFQVSQEQLNWRRATIENKYGGKKEAFQKEHPAEEAEAFSGTMNPYFDMGSVLPMLRSAPKAGFVGVLESTGYSDQKHLDDPFWNEERLGLELREERTGFLSIWNLPLKGREYFIGADVGEGIGEDASGPIGSYSAGVVFDRETREQVATWHGHVDPDTFGWELFLIGHLYNAAWNIVEENNHGLTTLMMLKKLAYPKIYCRYILDEKTRKRTKKMGWKTNVSTRRTSLDFLVAYIRDGIGEIRDGRILRECSTFVRNFKRQGRGEPARGCFGDLVMASAIGLAGNDSIGRMEKRVEKPSRRDEIKIPRKFHKFGFPLGVERKQTPWHQKRKASRA